METEPVGLEFSTMQSSTLGNRLRHAREHAKLTQAQLADRVGVTSSAISQWETGAVSRISAANLRRTAAVLRVSLDWLLSGEDGHEVSEESADYQFIEPADGELMALWHQLTSTQRAALLDQVRALAEHNSQLLAELRR